MSLPQRPGHLLSALGAVLLGVSLWLPWYALHFPANLGSELDRQTQGAPLLGQFMREIVAAIPPGLTVTFTAWRVFDVADVALALAAVLVLFTVIAQSSGTHDPSSAARLALAAGCASAVLAVVKLVDPPGPSGLLEVRHGAWVALGGAVLIALGGLLAQSPGSAAGGTAAFPPSSSFVPPAGDVPVSWDSASSMGPPGR